MFRKTALAGVIASVALSLAPGSAEAQQTYQVHFSKIFAVVPSEGDVMGVKGAIASAFPFPLVGYANDQLGKVTELTSEQVVSQLNVYKAEQEAKGGKVRFADFQRRWNLDAPKTLEQELMERGLNTLRGDFITVAVYGGRRPPDLFYMTYDPPAANTNCVLPLHNCGNGSNYYSLMQGDSKNVFNEPGAIALTSRRITYYLWDENPWPVPDKRLGQFVVDPAVESGKGWNVVAVEGGTSTGNSVYLIEYCVTKQNERCEPL